MRLGRHARWLLALVPFLAGCSGFWEAPGTSGSGGGCTTNCTTASSGAFYILSSGAAPQVAGGTIVSGKLNGISGSPWLLTNAPYSMAISPNGGFLYVSTTLGVFAYPIVNSVLGAATQLTQDDNALGIQIDSTGNWLIEAQQVTGGITMAALPLNAYTGAAAGTEITTSYAMANTAAAVQSRLAISPDDKNIFVPLGGGGVMVVPFFATVGAGVSPFGSATLIPVANAGGSSLSVAVDPKGRLFYIGQVAGGPSGSGGGLLAYYYSSLGGTLKQASGSPIASGGLAPNAILPDPAGAFVYVANGQGVGTAGNITSFSISASGSTYTVAATGSSVATGTQPLSLAEDNSSQFVFDAGGVSNPHFDVFTFSTTTPGKLDAQFVSPAAASPLAILAAP